MAYIGNDLRSNEDYKIIDDISSGFNGSATSFALQVGGATPVPFPKFEQQLLISVNGVIQEPDPTGSAGFKLLGTNIVFSSAPTNGHAFFGVIYAGADYVNAGGTFPDGSINFPSITFSADTNTGFTRTGSGTVALISDGNKIAQFPTSQGTSGQALITDGSGNLSFSSTISSPIVTGDLTIPDKIVHTGDTNTAIRFPAADTITAETGGSERIRINSNGVLLHGHNSPLSIGSTIFETQIVGDDFDNSSALFARFAADANGPAINFLKSRNATRGSNTTVQSGDELGKLRFGAADGNDFATLGGEILCLVDGTPGQDDMPSRFVFETTRDGQGSPTRSMTIDQYGRLFVGDFQSTSLGSGGVFAELCIGGATEGAGIHLKDDNSNVHGGMFTSDNTGAMIIRTITNHPLMFRTNNTDIARFDTSGRLLIGQSSSDDSTSMLQVKRANNSTIRVACSDATATNFAEIDLAPANSTVGASIRCVADGTMSGSSNQDAHLKFSTINNGTLAEGLRIDKNSRVGIQGAPTRAVLDVRASGGNNTMLTAVFGANEGQTGGSLSDNADKGGRVGLYHYDLDEEPFGLFSYGASNGTNALNFGGGTSLMNAATHLGFYTASNSTTTNGTERMRINNDGRVLISTTSARNAGGGNSYLTVERTDSSGRISILQNRNEAAGAPVLVLGKSRGTSNGSSTVVQNGDKLGYIHFAGADGSDLNSVGASIQANVDGTPGGNDMPSMLTFHTTPDGSENALERIQINASGDITFRGQHSAGTEPAMVLSFDDPGGSNNEEDMYRINFWEGTKGNSNAARTANANASIRYNGSTSDGGDGSIRFAGDAGQRLFFVNRLGNGGISGSFSKGSGSFQIDHPLESKKDTHYLRHSFIEGPQADNIYRGVVTLSSGTATINLDTVSGMTEGTFILLNTNVSCFTSNESDWTAVKGSVSGNTLTITAQDNTSTATVSWMVVGERHDAHVKDSNTEMFDSDGKLIVEPLKTVSSSDGE